MKLPKSTPTVVVLKPTRDVELIRSAADGTLTFRVRQPGCSLTHAFWIHTSEHIDESGDTSGLLCTKEVVIGSKGGLTLS